jgi:hypothetical protein
MAQLALPRTRAEPQHGPTITVVENMGTRDELTRRTAPEW